MITNIWPKFETINLFSLKTSTGRCTISVTESIWLIFLSNVLFVHSASDRLMCTRLSSLWDHSKGQTFIFISIFTHRLTVDKSNMKMLMAANQSTESYNNMGEVANIYRIVSPLAPTSTMCFLESTPCGVYLCRLLLSELLSHFCTFWYQCTLVSWISSIEIYINTIWKIEISNHSTSLYLPNFW